MRLSKGAPGKTWVNRRIQDCVPNYTDRSLVRGVRGCHARQEVDTNLEESCGFVGDVGVHGGECLPGFERVAGADTQVADARPGAPAVSMAGLCCARRYRSGRICRMHLCRMFRLRRRRSIRARPLNRRGSVGLKGLITKLERLSSNPFALTLYSFLSPARATADTLRFRPVWWGLAGFGIGS